MKLNVVDSDAKNPILIVNKKEATIKLNRNWDESTKERFTNMLSKVAAFVGGRNIAVKLKGELDASKPHYIRLKSSNKSSPKVITVNLHEINAI